MYALLLAFVTALVTSACSNSSQPSGGDAGGPHPGSNVPIKDAGACPMAAFSGLDAGTTDCGYPLDSSSPSNLGPGDAGTCESRTPVPCGGDCTARTLNDQISAIVSACNGFRMESTVAIAFVDGCPDRLYVALSGPGADDAQSCMARALEGTRFACAQQVPCWGYSESTLVPSAP